MHVSFRVSSKEVKKQDGQVRVGGLGGDPGPTFEKAKTQGAGQQSDSSRSPSTAVVTQTLLSTALGPVLAPMPTSAPTSLNPPTGPRKHRHVTGGSSVQPVAWCLTDISHSMAAVEVLIRSPLHQILPKPLGCQALHLNKCCPQIFH